jgi:hypothetical protein
MSDPVLAKPSSDVRPSPTVANKIERQIRYRKIAATGWTSRLFPGARSGLYLGDDHLLHAKQMILFEKYRRFYFLDIEAISFSKSNRWIWFSVVWGFLLFCSLFWYLGHQTWCYVVGALFCLFFGGLLLSNLIAGPTYVVNLQTAAQIRRLRPVERENQLIKFQQMIVPIVMQAQQSSANQAAA